jgi:hypothetical protein
LTVETKQVALRARPMNNCRLMSTSVHLVASLEARGLAIAAKAALMLIGFSAVIGQVVLLRELMVVFNGNEMSLGIFLATGLFWTAAGSIKCGTFALHRGNTRRMVAMLECLLGFSLPATILALWASKSLFQSVAGELVGPIPELLASLGCLSVFWL